jgi:hypothetical protein
LFFSKAGEKVFLTLAYGVSKNKHAIVPVKKVNTYNIAKRGPPILVAALKYKTILSSTRLFET